MCVRHRGSQTLYVSDVIEPHNCVDPGYGQLHVGLYIAAIQDAIDRWRQQQSSDSSPTSTPPAGPDNSDDDDLIGEDNQRKNQGSGTGLNRQPHGDNNSQGSGGGHNGHHQGGAGKGPSDELSMKEYSHNKVQETVHRARNRDLIFLYLQYDIYDSLIPASFLRSAPIMANPSCPTSPFSPRAIPTFRPEDCLNIILTSEIGEGATGKVHRGTLELDGEAMSRLDVVVKLAFDRWQRDSLQSEYEVYRHLRLKGVNGGIVTTLGLFDETEGAARALVMLYAGIPLSHWQATDTQSNLSQISHSALSTLEAIHHADILHGDVQLRNILISDSGVTTIIDFGHSTFCDNQRAKNNEFSRLSRLLGSLANT